MLIDLLTMIATELDIPIVPPNQRVWFIRTKSGRYYYDFLYNHYIALGWDRVSQELIKDAKISQGVKKERIEQLYPNEKRPGLILSQMDIFLNRMNSNDLVVIPSSGGHEVAIGRVGEKCEDITHKHMGRNYPHCDYVHKRKVEWIKTIKASQDVYLFKVLRGQQTISDITADANLVRRNIDPIYVAGESIHLTLQKETNNDLSLASNVGIQSNLLAIIDATAELYGVESFHDKVTIKTAVGSPGFWEIIFPDFPAALISVGIIRAVIGTEKSTDGSKTTGVLAVISKINEIINDHKNRKKTDAEIKQMEANTALTYAQAEKTAVEAEFIKSQMEKVNAEARMLELQNKQIELTLSGKTTETVRLEQEMLLPPDKCTVMEKAEAISQSGEGLCNAAAESGIFFDGQKVKRVG